MSANSAFFFDLVALDLVALDLVALDLVALPGAICHRKIRWDNVIKLW